MTPEEFSQWFTHHTSLFPGIWSWIKKQSDQSGGKVNGQSIADAWLRSLESVDFRRAMEASDRMSGLTDEALPKSFDRHPAWIRRQVFGSSHGYERYQPRFVDGQQVYECPVCLDIGSVIVWSERTIEAVRDGVPLDGWNTGTEGVRCTCRRGQQYAWLPVVYDAKAMLRAMEGKTMEAKIEDIQRFISERSL